ncbi:MAG: TerB family tellurite resistance protein [Magnetospiraceae bacterium]
MFDTIKAFFNQQPETAPGSATEADAVRVAVAALLLELTQMDDEVWEEEHEAVVNAVRLQFGLSETEAAALLDTAEGQRVDSSDYYRFTTVINEQFERSQKMDLLETLWRIAYADDVLHKYEEYLIRKVADLLHLPHQDFIAAKHRVTKS